MLLKGVRMKESKGINSSLFVLAKVNQAPPCMFAPDTHGRAIAARQRARHGTANIPPHVHDATTLLFTTMVGCLWCLLLPSGC